MISKILRNVRRVKERVIRGKKIRKKESTDEKIIQ